jgi:uncharacterized protein YkwD
MRRTTTCRPVFVASLLAGLALADAPADAATAQARTARATAGGTKAAAPARGSAAAQAVNQFRRENGLPPVADDAILLRAAQRQADAMASAGMMSHSVAGDFSDRMNQAGIRAQAAAENVAMGQHSLAEVMGDWKNSSGHRQNMLMSAATRIGVAQRTGAGGRIYWAMVLASPEPQPRVPGGAEPMVWGSPFPLPFFP